MKNIDDKQRFIELRANGKSFDAISKEINVSKPILIGWQKEFDLEISTLLFTNLQDLISQIADSKQERIKALFERLKKLNQEIDNRDLSTLSVKELAILQEKTERQIGKELERVKLKSEESMFSDFLKDEPLELDF